MKTGRLSRRGFVQTMVGASASRRRWRRSCWPLGRRQAQAPAPYKPTKRGGGGPLKVLWWQGADPPQPAFRRRHQGPGRLAHLLRAARRLGRRRQPRPGPRRRDSRAARTAASRADGKSVTWKLKQGVKWHDGKPFTADDVVFNWEYAHEPGDRRGHRRHLQGRQGREGRRLHRPGQLRASRRRSGPTPSSARAA